MSASHSTSGSTAAPPAKSDRRDARREDKIAVLEVALSTLRVVHGGDDDEPVEKPTFSRDAVSVEPKAGTPQEASEAEQTYAANRSHSKTRGAHYDELA